MRIFHGAKNTKFGEIEKAWGEKLFGAGSRN